jgi:redox-sensitive bicupin YhaK (pirin superfamily)
VKIRRANERGSADHGWLKSFHTFSFADYHDAAHMGFRSLRVINEDRVAPGKGFGTHAHRDMEIVSYVLEGALAHKDSIGTGSVIRPNDVQRMSAGTGVRHSEFNASKEELVHFLQIWIVPDRAGYAPSYEQKTFATEEKRGRLRLVASKDGTDGSVTIHQDARILAGIFAPGASTRYAIAKGRGAWVHVARGAIDLDGTLLSAGDAAAIDEPRTIEIGGRDAAEAAEVLVFDVT